jgi:hypothetical protein
MDMEPEPHVTEVVILNKDIYKKLEAQLPAPAPSATTTDIQAGYMLGVQYVLKVLREGFVIR